jgi:hypothetical protein
MRTLSAPAVTALAAGGVTIVQLVLMQFPSGSVALNTSTWDLQWGGVTYKGAFGLGTISALEDAPGEVRGLTFEMSGVSSAAVSLALDGAGEVQGTPLTIRTAILNADYQIVDAPIEWIGTLDTMQLSEDGDTAVIRASAESSAVDLLRGASLTYSQADQATLHPGDRAFEYVVSQADQPVVWPAREWFFR